MAEGIQQFGGGWTEKKLLMVESYLKAYTQALKNKGFNLWYIDAFAGTGYRELKSNGIDSELLFPELAEDPSQQLLEGSVRKALQIDRPFDRYVFIEQSARKCMELTALPAEFPGLNIQIEKGDANDVIKELCRKTNWRSNRAVLFLDPFGMQVEWSTLEAIAATQAIDLWLLFPLGLGAIRLLKRDGNISESWRHRLDVFFGGREWQEVFFRVEQVQNLFGDTEDQVLREVDLGKIQAFFTAKLQGVFEQVAPNPKLLMNSRGQPLFLLFFAVGNPKGADLAVRIAGQILKKG
jgi:three-Cys-motif partner protein